MDYVMVNLLFNIKDWVCNEEDLCWCFGVLFVNNVNYVWIQYILYKLVLGGWVGVVMVNGLMLLNFNGEGDICVQIVEVDLVFCMVVLFIQLFCSIGILVCLWFFVKDKVVGK